MEGQFCIKSNNTYTKENCVFCGTRFDMHEEYWIFPEGTFEPMCEDCCKKHAPELVALFELVPTHVFYKVKQ